jgi:hypothetical protein
MYFQDDLSDVMDVLHARGFSLEVSGSQSGADPDISPTKWKVLLDGEIYEVESPSFELWYS